MASPFYADPNKQPKPHEASGLVFDNYKRSEDLWVSPKRDQWEELYKAYRAIIEVPDDSLMSALVVPLIFTNVEDFKPRLTANRPRIEVWGRHEEDEARAEQSRFLLFYAWEHLGIPLKILDLVTQGLIYGIGWGKVGYRREKAQRAVRRIQTQNRFFAGFPIPGSEFSQPSTSVEEVLIYDDAFVDVCEVDQVFPDPDGWDEDSCQYIIHRVPSTLAEIEGAVKDGEPLYSREAIRELKKKIGKGGNPRKLNTAGDSLREMVRTDIDGTGGITNDPHKLQFHLLEQWEDSKVTVVIEEYPELPPLRQDWNEVGEKPFFRYTPIPQPNQISGLGLAEMLLSLQVEQSTLHSLRMDNLSYSAHQMWKVLKTSGINWRDVRFRPGGMIPVRTMEDIEPLRKSFTDFSLYREADEVRRIAQKVGSTDTFSGVRSDLTGGTATEATLLFESSSSRATQMFQVLSEQTLKRMAKLLLRHYDLYLESPKFVRIAGDAFSEPERHTITPEELLSGSGDDLDVVFDVAATEPSSQQYKIQKYSGMLQAFASIGMPISHPFMRFILVELARAFGKERPEDLFNSQEAQQAELLAALGQLPQGAVAGASGQETIADSLAAEGGAEASLGI